MKPHVLVLVLGLACLLGGWTKRESTDPMTDARNVSVLLKAAAPIQGPFGGREFPVLVVRCDEGRFDVFVALGTVVDSDYGELHRVTGRYRFGRGDAHRLVMSISDSRNAVFLPRPKEWAKRLVSKDGEVLRIEVRTYRAGAQVAKFRLRGAKRHVTPVLAACP